MVSSGGTAGDMLLLNEDFHDLITKMCSSVTYHRTGHFEPNKDMGFDEFDNSFSVAGSGGLSFYPLRDISPL